MEVDDSSDHHDVVPGGNLGAVGRGDLVKSVLLPALEPSDRVG